MRGVEIRGQEETKKFREAMVKKLNQPRNRAKGSWTGCGRAYLVYRLMQELFELVFAVARCRLAERKFYLNPSVHNLERLQDRRNDVLYEAADVGNFAMMTADVCGAFKSNWGK